MSEPSVDFDLDVRYSDNPTLQSVYTHTANLEWRLTNRSWRGAAIRGGACAARLVGPVDIGIVERYIGSAGVVGPGPFPFCARRATVPRLGVTTPAIPTFLRGRGPSRRA